MNPSQDGVAQAGLRVQGAIHVVEWVRVLTMDTANITWTANGWRRCHCPGEQPRTTHASQWVVIRLSDVCSHTHGNALFRSVDFPIRICHRFERQQRMPDSFATETGSSRYDRSSSSDATNNVTTSERRAVVIIFPRLG
jgi:hypothetical protein